MRRFLFGFVVGFLTALLSLLSIGTFLRSAEGPGRADVIVSLSGDTNGARAATAAALYVAGYARLVLFSGAAIDPESLSSAELMAKHAAAAGVPQSAILIEPLARSTDDSARLVRDLMQSRGLKRALLVTSGYHQRRAALEFSRAFAGTELSFANVPAEDPDWDALLWWLDPEQSDLTLRELAKLAFAYLNR